MGVALAAGPSSAENSMIFGPAGVVGPACPSLSHSILVSMASPLFLTPHLPCFFMPPSLFSDSSLPSAQQLWEVIRSSRMELLCSGPEETSNL